MCRRIAIAVSLLVSLGLPSAPALADDGGGSEAEQAESADSNDDEMSEKEEAIRQLLEITGTPELGLQMAERILEQMKQTHPDVPDKFWTEFEAEMNKEAFIDMIVPIYDKHFSKEDIEKLIEFYQTDIGQKYVEKLPTLTKESMEAGRRWGRQIGQRIVEQLKERGYH